MAEYSSKTEDDKCIFCEIVSGKIKTPGIFWEDKEFIAFLSIDPNTKGFSCVIPKQHFGSDIFKMPEADLQKFIIAAQKVGKILENHFDDVGRVGMIVEGMGVDHVHIKLVPMHGTESFKNGGWSQILSGKNFWFDKYEGWISSGSGPMADSEELKKLAEEIRSKAG
ncbi:MAG: HIT family protein [Candidatus Staskawiczbacteria bacterium]|jgi:diadenosine tetraphosphate (Ap4A) HIT family hydrolase